MQASHIQDETHITTGSSRLQDNANQLASRMPRLMLSARTIANHFNAGIHGRRRSGTGENFWQYRHFGAGESVNRIDWRRSARDDQLYVREREWEAAHTVWIGIDRSRSMGFQSPASEFSKLEKAVVLALALADVLVQGGERVGLLGLTRPTAQRHIIDFFGQTLAAQTGYAATPWLADQATTPSDVILFSDFLHPPEEHAATLNPFPIGRNQGICVTLADPAEETFPFSGRTELIDPESGARMTFGRAQNIRQDYQRRYAAHRDAVEHETLRLGWGAVHHRTDHPATEALLALHMQLTNR